MGQYSYASIMVDAQRARWALDDVTTTLSEIDFGAVFLPDSLVHVGPIGLAPDESRLANQIRAFGYTHLFALVEKFILPFVMLHAGSKLHRSSEELLALMQFGEEEAKHIALFERFGTAFELGFGSTCEAVGPSYEVTSRVLAEDPLSVALMVLHIEWMTQDHYLKSVRGAEDIDAQYKNLLRCHWVEEAQHARLDKLVIDELVSFRSPDELAHVVGGYLRICRLLGDLFDKQVQLDIEAFERAARPLTSAERDRWRAVQAPALRDAFLLSGARHPRFVAAVEQHFPDALSAIEAQRTRWAFTLAA